MSALQRFSDGKQEAPIPQAKQFVCKAFGCPVCAGIADGETQFICRFHFGTSPESWAEITKKLRERMWMVRLADTCDTPEIFDIPLWHQRATEFALKHGREDLAPNPDREITFPKLYAARISAVLRKECSVERIAPVVAGIKPQGLQAIGSYLPKLPEA